MCDKANVWGPKEGAVEMDEEALDRIAGGIIVYEDGACDGNCPICSRSIFGKNKQEWYSKYVQHQMDYHGYKI